MKKPETIFREKVRPLLKAIDQSVWFTLQQSTINGTPDISGVVASWPVWLELKASAQAKRAALQVYNLERINRAGGFALFVYPENWSDVHSFLLNLSVKGRSHDRDDLRRDSGSIFFPSDS